MSYTIDINILLYATDTSSPHQPSARQFLRDRLADSEILCLTWPTLMGYLRIATHPRIFSSPLSHEDALSNVEALIAMPQSRVIVENERFGGAYREVTEGLAVRGNLVPDAHVAALLRLHDVKTIYTNDSDFRKFVFLNVQNPLA